MSKGPRFDSLIVSGKWARSRVPAQAFARGAAESPCRCEPPVTGVVARWRFMPRQSATGASSQALRIFRRVPQTGGASDVLESDAFEIGSGPRLSQGALQR